MSVALLLPITKMAKEKSADKEERKKEKKEKRSERDGVHKSSKKDKKEKKISSAAEDANVTTALLNHLEAEKPGSVVVKEDGDLQVKVKSAPLLGALVPFANPLADEKVGKKVLKSIKKGKDNSFKFWGSHSLTLAYSGQEQVPETRRQRSRQIPPQVCPRSRSR